MYGPKIIWLCTASVTMMPNIMMYTAAPQRENVTGHPRDLRTGTWTGIQHTLGHMSRKVLGSQKSCGMVNPLFPLDTPT
jgi:hypothetical protein